MTRAEGSLAERLFWDLGRAVMARDEDVVEGTIMNGRCLRVGKEFLALVDYKGSANPCGRAGDEGAYGP